MRWLTGSSTEQAGSNAYHYGITGYYSGNSGSNNGGVATYMNLIGEDIRQDADEQFALEGTIYSNIGLNKKPKANMNDYFDIDPDKVKYEDILENVNKFRIINNI